MQKVQELSANENILLFYLLNGNYRSKYIPQEVLKNKLNVSNETLNKSIKMLVKKGYCFYEKVPEKRYKIFIITNKAFELKKNVEIKENQVSKAEELQEYYIMAGADFTQEKHKQNETTPNGNGFIKYLKNWVLTSKK